MGNSVRSGSMYDAIGGVTYICYAWENCVRTEMPDTNIIYDEGLSYETAIKLFRENNDYQDNNLDPLPLIAYKRTVSRPSSERLLGVRSDAFRACTRDSEGNLLRYNVALIEFDLLFAYFAKDVELQDRFEIAFNTGQGLSELETFWVDYPEIGDVKYSIEWKDLEEYTINEDEGNHFKSIIGSATVRGFVFSFDDMPAGEIKQIDAKIISSGNLSEPELDELVSECIIEEGE